MAITKIADVIVPELFKPVCNQQNNGAVRVFPVGDRGKQPGI